MVSKWRDKITLSLSNSGNGVMAITITSGVKKIVLHNSITVVMTAQLLQLV
jgi:hypothetical protein